MANTPWLVDGDMLLDRPRRGGRDALAGFHFQSAYAVLKLADLLTCKDGLVAVRYEAAQDVDLLLNEGRQVYVQLKHYVMASWSLKTVYEAYAGFTRDVIDACLKLGVPAPTPDLGLAFSIIATSIPNVQDAFQILRGTYLPDHATHVANEVDEKYRRGQSLDFVKGCARYALENTKFQVGIGDDLTTDLLKLAGAELTNFGVPRRELQVSLKQLLALLRTPGTYFVQDVAACLKGLEQEHPATRKAAIRLLPNVSVLPGREWAAEEFQRGGTDVWSAIAHGLDVPRKDADTIKKAIRTFGKSGGLVLLRGSGGTGKTTLARRVAWDLHHSENFLALDVFDPKTVKERTWDIVLELAEFTGRIVILIIDEIFEHDVFLEQFERWAGPGIIVLGTTRPKRRQQDGATALKTRNTAIDLSPLEQREMDALRASLGMDEAHIPDGAQALLQTGQIFPLSLVLQKGSLNAFAESILMPLFGADQELANAYLDLCVSTVHDQSIPESVMALRSRQSSNMDRNPLLQGLVFRTGVAQNRLRAGHSIIAAAMLDAARLCGVTRGSPTERALDIVRMCDPSDPEQRRYGLRLLQNHAFEKKYRPSVRALQDRFASEARRLGASAEYTDLRRLSYLLRAIGSLEASAEFAARATPDTVRSGQDAIFYMRSEPDFHTAFPTLERVYSGSDTAFGRRNFVKKTSGKGTPEEKRRTARLMKGWLDRAGYPPAETKAVLDMLSYGEPDLAAKFIAIVEGALARSAPSVELARMACRVVQRAASTGAFILLVRYVSRSLSLDNLSEEALLVRDLSITAAAMGRNDGWNELFQLIISAAAHAEDLHTRIRLLYDTKRIPIKGGGDKIRPMLDDLRSAGHGDKIRGLSELYER